MKILLKDIKPNPFRNLDQYPLNPAKVAKLQESIEATDFWDNIVVRKTDDGYELAYGHHRIAAAKAAGLKEADFIVKKLSDEMMLQIMVRENDDESRPKVSVLFEGVKATVAALAAGTISIGEISKDARKDQLRHAPSFVIGAPGVDSTPGPYTADSIGLFLGETMKSGKATQNLCTVLNALELIERKMLSERELDGLSITQIVNLIPIAVNRYQRAKEAQAAALRESERVAEAARVMKEEAARRKEEFDAQAAKNKAAIAEKAEQMAAAEAEENDKKYKKHLAEQEKAKLAEKERLKAREKFEAEFQRKQALQKRDEEDAKKAQEAAKVAAAKAKDAIKDAVNDIKGDDTSKPRSAAYKDTRATVSQTIKYLDAVRDNETLWDALKDNATNRNLTAIERSTIVARLGTLIQKFTSVRERYNGRG